MSSRTEGEAGVSGEVTAPDVAVFYRHEIELLINRALAVRDPLTARMWRWTRWSKRVDASDAALYRFHELAAAALTRFNQSEPVLPVRKADGHG